MRIELYKVESGLNHVNKVLGDPVSQPLRLKRDVNILNPVLTLREKEGFNYDGFNYCYIEELERYYFIDNVSRIHSKIVEISLTVDVLQTYKDEILNSNARFYRGIKTGDYYSAPIESVANAEIDLHGSGFEFVDAETLILSTMGVKENE